MAVMAVSAPEQAPERSSKKAKRKTLTIALRYGIWVASKD
jgi:hypothetical protein